ncbi:MAG: peroxiredoxin [Candidatus Azotimanducaceae bacterium]|jgi:peroxiredoxin
MSKQNFQDKLAELRAAHCDNLSTPELAILTRGTAILRRSDILKKCLQAGETAPDFTFIGQKNEHSSLYKMLETGPVLANFFRGYWCAYCNTERESLASISTQLKSIGCQSLSISPQPSKTVEENLSQSDEVIFDKNNHIADLFGIVYRLSQDEIRLFESWDLNLDEVNESGTWDLPLPATYLISQERIVTFQFLDVDVRRRCSPDDLLDAIALIK